MNGYTILAGTMKKRKHRHSKLIDKLGGTTEVANLMDVTVSCVSQWRRRGIPHQAERYLRAVHPEAFEKPARQ